MASRHLKRAGQQLIKGLDPEFYWGNDIRDELLSDECSWLGFDYMDYMDEMDWTQFDVELAQDLEQDIERELEELGRALLVESEARAEQPQ